jgi:hypothetical protein
MSLRPLGRGRNGYWETKIGKSVLTVCNVAGSPTASFTNRLAYSEANGPPMDQADAKITLRVRLLPSSGATHGAGVMFRKSPGQDAYYALLAVPGDAIMLYLNTGKALKLL